MKPLKLTSMLEIQKLIEIDTGEPAVFVVLVMTQEEHDRIHDTIHAPEAKEGDMVAVDYVTNVAHVHPCVMMTAFPDLMNDEPIVTEHEVRH